jgi:primosomal replication protein N''
VRHPDDVVRKIRPIEVIHSNGIYVSQTNPTEVTDVVSYLARLWKEPAPPSAGVVTFNRKQAEAIEEALEDQAEEDDHFRDALMRERERAEGGEDMGFFVKNVENVQGDERDVIIFSSTFGPNAEGTFRRNFGVLGQTGGERRLNVGVTRARQKVVMVTSMPIAKISEMLTTRNPPSTPRDYLQVYLEYARMISDGEVEAGRTLLGRMVTERTSDPDRQAIEVDGFTESVESYLRELGWAPAKARGGAFGLDFAIVDARTGLYGIGIECDAPRHRILSTARAREVWRPKVLKQGIPHVHRVSSHAWFHSGGAERHRLKSAVENALGVGGRV